jgi:hypothetical protein
MLVKMKTLAQIEKISDLDSRVINAAALLEAELRPPAANSKQEIRLGDLVQRQQCFAKDGFIRDVNFALGVRNAIAHLSNGVEPSSDEKMRAAEYLIRAIRLARKATGKNADTVASKSQVADDFDEAGSQAALKAFYRGRTAMAGVFAVVAFIGVFVGALVLCAMTGQPFPPLIVLGGGAIVAVPILIVGMTDKSISQAQYYSLPGSRFDNGDHRCIFCGMRAKNGRGIYTHGQYRSSIKFHECSKCKELLYTS